MDKDKLFSLFNETTPSSSQPSDEKSTPSGPYIMIGMFIKLIQNHKVFNQKLSNFLKSEKPVYNTDITKNISEMLVYDRSWEFIKNVNIESEECIMAIMDFNPVILVKNLNYAIEYFESREEYEKCAFLLKIQKIARKSHSLYLTSNPQGLKK